MLNFGRILEVDLGSKTWQFTPYSAQAAAQVLAGRGFNVWYLYQNMPLNLAPSSPDNALVLSCGALTGTGAPVSSRLHINALSPQTGLLGSSNIGGGFAPQLRALNIQTIIIRGQAPKPVCLLIEADKVTLTDAQSLWGLDTYATHEHLQSRYAAEKIRSLIIGPGAENGARFGCIMADRDHSAGRTGMGTVMGSKRLKAIVVQASLNKISRPIEVNARPAIRNYILQMKNSPHYKGLITHGGAGYVTWADEMGILSTRNYRENHFDAADQIDGKNLVKNITRRRGCPGCPLQCKAELKFGGGKPAMRPEFESMLALGSKCGLGDLEALVYLDNLCSRMGLDTISAGNSIAFAMDLFERGILTAADTDGLKLNWGNSESMQKLIRQMALREGFGAILAQGVRDAAKTIGRGAERFAPHIKGLELAGYHPYNTMGTALGYAVASRGADFNDIFATLEYKWLPEKAFAEFGTPEAVNLDSIYGKAQLVRRAMITGVVLDCLGLCKVPALCLICAFDLVGEAKLLGELGGWPLTASELFSIGERIVNLERLFNIRQGATAADDRLPDMFFSREYNSGEKASKPQEWMEPMKHEFYRAMGWNDQGLPTAEKLAELDLLLPPYLSETAA